MGIYADTSWKYYAKTGVLIKITTWPGVKHVEVFQKLADIEDRDNCFCCSCSEFGNSDPYCRNHGWAGMRPCEDHNMPGQADDIGKMPDSVQEVRGSKP